MKIVHLMQQEKFTKPVAEFYNVYFNNGEHEICYINTFGNPSLINENLSIKQTEFYYGGHSYSLKNLRFIKWLSQFDYIVLHSMFFSHFLFAINKKLCKKIVWIEWGYDLYNWDIKKKDVFSKIGTAMRNNCGAFVGIFPPDCDYFKKKFPCSKALIFYAVYCCSTSVPQEFMHYSEHSQLQKTVENDQPIYIQVGHSATRFINHIKTLNSLAHLASENIRLFIPLSYGDKEYANDVRMYAKKIFADKAIFLEEMLPKDEYFDLINRVDIAVFDTERQIALGNIDRMIFRNVKMYMPKNSVMYDYFTSRGIPIQCCDSLDNINIDELSKSVKSGDPEEFANFIEELSNMDKKIEPWCVIYNKLRDKVNR